MNEWLCVVYVHAWDIILYVQVFENMQKGAMGGVSLGCAHSRSTNGVNGECFETITGSAETSRSSESIFSALFSIWLVVAFPFTVLPLLSIYALISKTDSS